MTEKFESPNLTKGPFETEAIPKIEKIQNHREYPFLCWDLIADFPYPKILPEKRAAFEKKWQNVDILSLDMDDPKHKEYAGDRRQLDEELQKIMEQKSPQEILSRALESHNGYLQKGEMATSVDDLMRAHHQAYKIARFFLTKAIMEEAAQSCLDMLWRRIKEVDINDPRRAQLIGAVFGAKRWFSDVNINLSRSPEKAGKILAYLLVNGSLTDNNKEKLFNTLVATRKIKKGGEEGKAKEKVIIVNRDLLSGGAREELRSLIEAGKEKEVMMATNFLEKKGVLDLEKDAAFFEGITRKGQ